MEIFAPISSTSKHVDHGVECERQSLPTDSRFAFHDRDVIHNNLSWRNTFCLKAEVIDNMLGWLANDVTIDRLEPVFIQDLIDSRGEGNYER